MTVIFSPVPYTALSHATSSVTYAGLTVTTSLHAELFASSSSTIVPSGSATTAILPLPAAEGAGTSHVTRIAPFVATPPSVMPV